MLHNLYGPYCHGSKERFGKMFIKECVCHFYAHYKIKTIENINNKKEIHLIWVTFSESCIFDIT